MVAGARPDHTRPDRTLTGTATTGMVPRMTSVKVSSKHQISLPSDARRRLGIQAGDRLSVEIREDAIVLRRRSPRPSERLMGLGREVWDSVDPVQFVRRIRDEVEAHGSPPDTPPPGRRQ